MFPWPLRLCPKGMSLIGRKPKSEDDTKARSIFCAQKEFTSFFPYSESHYHISVMQIFIELKFFVIVCESMEGGVVQSHCLHI